ncbi:hypothetical protein Tco_0766632 [Tanacetum coccineum]
MKEIIKEQVKAQVSKIMPNVEKYVTESLGVKCKEDESSKETTHKESKSTSSSKGASRSQPKSSGKSAHVEEHGQKVDDLEDQPHQEFNTGNDDVTPEIEAQDDGNVVELEYHLEEVFKATNDQLDWHNPEGRPYPHDLSKPLTLIPNEQGRQVIAFDHFINNDLEYLKGWSSSQRYTTSITKTKAANYGQVNWNEDKKDKLYKFREGDFKILRSQEIEDMLLLFVQDMLANLNLEEQYALNVALRMFTRCIVIQERVEDIQLESKATRRRSTSKG